MNKCAIVKDLLPLYADGVCGEETKKFVTEHLYECDDCCEELENLRFDFKVSSADEKEAVKKFKKKTERKATVKLLSVVLAVAIAAFGAVNVVWYVRYDKAINNWASMNNEYMSATGDYTSLIEVILGENNSYGIDTEKYQALYIDVLDNNYLDTDGLLRISDGKNINKEISTYIEVRIDRNGDYKFLVNQMYAPQDDEEDYWPCFSIDADMKLILTDVEEYVNENYKNYMNNRSEEEARVYVKEYIEKKNAQDKELYEKCRNTVKDFMIILNEGFGIGNVKS